MRSGCDGDGDVGLPEIVRRISYNSKRKIHRLDIRNEAVVLVDNAYQYFIAGLWFNAWKVYAKRDIYPRASRRRNKGSHFVKTDHLSCLLLYANDSTHYYSLYLRENVFGRAGCTSHQVL